MNEYKYSHPFTLENGVVLNEIDIAYHTWGILNATGDNVIWICHALTANSNAAEWWPGMIGPGLILDTEKYFVVCANIIGSCYGSTGPVSIDVNTGKPYYHRFPAITVRDMVKAHQLLRDHLQIKSIHTLIGGSMGGYQALEWSIKESQRIQQLVLVVTSAKESAWGIAIHTAQRLAIEADETWNKPTPDAGKKGLIAARAFGMVTYRNYQAYNATQTDFEFEKLDGYKASGYIIYQGNKLANRFNAYSYWLLTKTMDSHNIARGRSEKIEEVLKTIQQKSIVIGIKSDFLCPLSEQEQLATHIPHAKFFQIDSAFGHDGFLVETKQITNILKSFIE
ncbi:MAG TPA: homoserine O-acetyltransferase [Segetibacter sp.]|jgi:homoserine O-acetyltransferase